MYFRNAKNINYPVQKLEDFKPTTSEKYFKSNSALSFLKKTFPGVTDDELHNALCEVRRRHGKLSGLSIKIIRGELQEVFGKKKIASKIQVVFDKKNSIRYVLKYCGR